MALSELKKTKIATAKKIGKKTYKRISDTYPI